MAQFVIPNYSLLVIIIVFVTHTPVGSVCVVGCISQFTMPRAGCVLLRFVLCWQKLQSFTSLTSTKKQIEKNSPPHDAKQLQLRSTAAADVVLCNVLMFDYCILRLICRLAGIRWGDVLAAVHINHVSCHDARFLSDLSIRVIRHPLMTCTHWCSTRLSTLNALCIPVYDTSVSLPFPPSLSLSLSRATTRGVPFSDRAGCLSHAKCNWLAYWVLASIIVRRKAPRYLSFLLFGYQLTAPAHCALPRGLFGCYGG